MSMHRRLTPPPPNRHLAEFGTATSEGLRAMRERAGWSEEGEQQRIEEGWTRRAYETIALLEAEQSRQR